MRIESVKRLVVRGPNWIGDAVMAEPALSTLRGLFPTAEITLLVKPVIAELLGNHPGLDRILVYDSRRQHAGLTGKWALARALRRLRFELAILFQNAFEAALLAFLAGIPRRYGYGTDGRSLLLTDPVAVPERTRVVHQSEYYLELLRPLGAEGPPGPPRLFLSDGEVDAMRRRLAQAGIGEADLVVGLNPGSTYGSAKRWLPERFAETADRLAREHQGKGLRVVIVGARGEEALGRAIAERMQTEPVLLSGQTSIRELMAVIHRCGLFITNDTGPMHIAAAFGVPLVAVFGPTDSRTTAPFGNGHGVLRHPVECSPCLLRECPIDHRCMTGVSVDNVFDAAVKQLSSLSGSSGFSRSSGTNQINPTNQIIQTNETNRLKGITVFLDRDGTLNRDTGYVKTPEELELFPDSISAVARLKRAGARVVLTTNQSGVARGLFTTAALEAVHARLRALLEAGGASLDAIYYCPHHPDDGCSCRKPETGLVDRAIGDLGLDPSRAYVVGDQNRDVELARRIGARSVLVTTGPTSQEALGLMKSDGVRPDHVAAELDEAVDWIMEDAAKMEDRQLSFPGSLQW